MPKNILLLGEFSTGKSAFLNMLLGVQLLPEQLDSTNLPIVKIHSGKPGGIWLREPGQKNPRAIESWSDIPEDWNEFDHAEVTVSGHPYLDKGLVFWDTPGINTTNSHHKQHLDKFLKSKSSEFISVLYFVSGNLTSTSIEFLKQNRALWDNMLIFVNIKEVKQEIQSRQIETEVKKTVWTQLGNLPVELLYIGDACEAFNELSEQNREGLTDYELMWKWSTVKVDLADLLQRHEDDVIGTDIFDIILTFAEMPEPESEKEQFEEKTKRSISKASTAKKTSTTLLKKPYAKSISSEAENFDLMVKTANSLLKKRKPKEAVNLFRRAADYGHAEAQYHIGRCYATGKGLQRSSEEALKWYQRSADQGNTEAQYQVGRCYELGKGVKKKIKEAIKWYKISADEGHAEGQYCLGNCYHNGRGVRRDARKTIKWLQKAADQGHTVAQYELGKCYLDGWGVEEDAKVGLKWFNKAASKRHVGAQYYIGECYLTGWGVEENEKVGFKWLKKAAELGHREARYQIGKCYEDGWGVTINRAQAIRWFLEAANQGHPEAKRKIGR
jgi:TPR repeat protein